MEKLYRKVGKRYVDCGYSVPDLSDGIWLVQNNPHCKSLESLVWKVGDLKRPVDVITHASLQTMSDDIAKYIVKLTDENSEEWEDAKNLLGNGLSGPIGYYNTTAYDLATLLIRKIAIEIEKSKLTK